MVKAARDMVKRLDPTRPVIDASGGKQFDTDVVALMRYGFSGPHSYQRARAHYPGLRAVSAAKHSGQTDPPASRLPLICGEMGGYVFFPDMDKFKRQWKGANPWPLVRPAGLGWGELRSMGEGYDERFLQWGLDEVYATSRALPGSTTGQRFMI